MAEGLAVPGGEELSAATVVDPGEGDIEFSRMMASAAEGISPEGNEPTAPPKRERAPEGEQPKRRRRPSKDVRARTRDAMPGDEPAGKGKPAEPKDYRPDLKAVGDGLWLGLSGISFTAPYAAIVHANQDGLAEALNQGAQVNPGVRDAVEKFTSGTGSAWMLHFGILGVNIAMQGYQIMRNPVLRQRVTEANAKAVQAYMAQMGAVPVMEAE